MFDEREAMGMALYHRPRRRYRATKRFWVILLLLAVLIAGALYGRYAGVVAERVAEILDKPLVTSTYWQAVFADGNGYTP